MRRLAIVTQSMAPYRLRFYEALAECMPETEIHLLCPAMAGTDHAWTNIEPKTTALRVHLVATSPMVIPFFKWSPFEHRRKTLRLPSRQLLRTLREIKPDLLILYELSPYVLAGLGYALWHRKKRVLATDLGDRLLRNFALPVRLLHHSCRRLMHGVIAHTLDAAQSDRPVPTVICPHAIDPREYAAVERETGEVCRFLYVGDLVPLKGVDLLLKAWIARGQPGRGARNQLAFVGEGSLAWCEPLLHEAKAVGEVELLGFREGAALIAEYQRANVFVLPSRYDTYGVVSHEAAATGLPLLLSCHAGASQVLLEEGKNGFRIDPEDTAEFAKRMTELAGQPDLRRRFGARSAELADEFSVQNSGRKAAAFLRSLMATSASG